jgi:hypothetical protein
MVGLYYNICYAVGFEWRYRSLTTRRRKLEASNEQLIDVRKEMLDACYPGDSKSAQRGWFYATTFSGMMCPTPPSFFL